MGIFPWHKERCYNGGKQHNFKARYDEKPRTGNVEGKYRNTEQFRRLLYYNEYVCDVCIWCGQTIKRI